MFNKIFKDSDGKIAIFQAPNVPLLGWIFFKILSSFFDSGVRIAFEQLSTLSLLVWAFLEISTGVNYFRRLAGATVFTFVITGLLQ